MEIKIIFKNVMFQYDSSVSREEREFVSQIDANTTLSRIRSNTFINIRFSTATLPRCTGSMCLIFS
ncbi:MAG: hypothetical protein FWC70_05785 [Defluviitaleaceae bacterium]|nr:hypothetical protein [Defluviitaleaceae bacterium]